MQSLLWFLVWLLMFGGVSAPLHPVPGRPSATGPILLDFGAGTTVQDGSLTLTFADVAEDSRCPADVSCVWPGMVVVALQAELKGQAAQTLQLGGMTDSRGVIEGPVTAGAVTQTAAIGAYEVQLVAVTPYPATAATPADKAEYQISLLVRPVAAGQ